MSKSDFKGRASVRGAGDSPDKSVASFVPPPAEPLYPGFRFPEYLSVGELYSLGKKNPCGDWAMKNIWSGSREKVFCSLPSNHEYPDEYGLPHIDFDQSKAWQDAWITDVWYKDKATDSQGNDTELPSEHKAAKPQASKKGPNHVQSY